MLYRKISKYIEDFLNSGTDKILILQGARQVGKSYIIRSVGTKLYKNFVEINFAKDDEGDRIFKKISSIDEFYLALGAVAGDKLSNYGDTLVFIDEIQQYPQYLTWLKFLREDHRYHFIASGSMLGIALRKTTSIPIGSIVIKNMYQLDFEEFLIANNVGESVIDTMHRNFRNRQMLPQNLHQHILDLFKRYLLVGGMPDAVNAYIATHNIVKVREVQYSIIELYKDDASKYESDSSGRLVVKRIYDMVPSQMENKKKRVVAKDIKDKPGDRFSNYVQEFEYLIGSGIAIAVNAISNPRYPLVESAHKNLLKLYLNDAGLLSAILYHNNIMPIINDQRSVNLGACYENVVAQELLAHGHKLFYYDNKQRGEVDFLVDDYENLSVLPIEVKSGRDYKIHSALNNLISNPDYHIKEGLVLGNTDEITRDGNILHMPVYNVMFIDANAAPDNVYF